ncbi:MAG: M17 family peptidase N-terminal domain-containing protein, partial [Thermodesulfobacteriota bacterium]
MQVRVQTSPLTAIESDVLVVPLAQGEPESDYFRVLDPVLQGLVKDHIRRSGFTGKDGESLRIQTQGRLPSRDLLLLGLGKRDQLETETWRRAAGRAHKEAKASGTRQLAWFFATEYTADA